MRKGMLAGSGKQGYYNWLATDSGVHSDSAMGLKQPQAVSPMATMRIDKAVKKAEANWAFAKNEFLTETEILRVKHRINNGKITVEAFWQMRQPYGSNVRISPEQTAKGLRWLKNLWKTPMGKEREHNPFGAREQEILMDFDRFELIDFYDKGNLSFVNVEPIYRVWGRNGNYFDYYYDGFRHEAPIQIIG